MFDNMTHATICSHPSFGMLNPIIHTEKVLMRLPFGMYFF